MNTRLQLLACLAGGAALTGCADVEASLEDPGAFQCREEAALFTGVSDDTVTAQPINFDAFGNQNYTVEAGGASYRCTYNADSGVIAFNRI